MTFLKLPTSIRPDSVTYPIVLATLNFSQNALMQEPEDLETDSEPDDSNLVQGMDNDFEYRMENEQEPA